MAVITCKIPESLNTRLEAIARDRRVSKSRIVREAIEARVRKKGTRSLTVYDLVKDLAGTVRGPRDLSTNPKYLEGLGE